MSSIAKSNISLSKKDLQKSRIPPVASRNVVFYHKATVGDLTINLLSLTLPSSEMPTAVQATADEISGAKLYVNKKNLDLVSSSKGQLIPNLDYVVIDSTTISLIGSAFTSGAEVDEIFVGTINSAPMSDLIVASAKSVTKTYTLAVGQTTLNLAQEYQVGANPNEDVGIIKVYVNGILAIRDADYQEVDAGSGYGTTIEFLSSPATIPWEIVVDFGVMAITDNNAIGAIENLAGSIQKIADDLAVVAGTTATDYYTASPSDVERRAFGDWVLKMLDVEVPEMSLTQNAGALIVGAVTTAPTKGTIIRDVVNYRQLGDCIDMEVDYVQTAGSGAAGSGVYLFSLPAGLQFDLGKIGANTTLSFDTFANEKNRIGEGVVQQAAGVMGHLMFFAYDSTRFYGKIELFVDATVGGGVGTTTGNTWAHDTAGMSFAANLGFKFRINAPIAGWVAKKKIRDIIGV